MSFLLKLPEHGIQPVRLGLDVAIGGESTGNIMAV